MGLAHEHETLGDTVYDDRQRQPCMGNCARVVWAAKGFRLRPMRQFL